MFQTINVTLEFRERVYGGVPQSKDLLDKYIEAVFGAKEGDETYNHVAKDALPNGEQTDESNDKDEAQEKKDISSTGFRSDDKGLYLADFQIKALIKQGGSMLDLTISKRGTKSTLGEGLFVKGYLDGELTNNKIYFQPIREKPDGYEDFAGNVRTRQGSRSILKRCDYVEKPIVQFQLWILENRVAKTGNKLTVNDLKSILELGQELGIGSCRSLEKGKFNLTQFEIL